MIDTHSHLLPEIDHGCPDLETSLLMVRAAVSSGVSTIVCTPHLTEWDGAVIGRAGLMLRRVKAAVATAGDGPDLRLGFEVDLGIAATVDTTTLSALTIEDSWGAILLEMPYSGWPPFIEETIFRLSAAGFVPVLAHPERNERIQRSSELLAGCLKAGAVAQATAGSLGGEFGRSAERTFFRLISEGLISLLASDAHAYRSSSWTMHPMLEALEGRVSEDDLAAFTEINPRRLLHGKKPHPVKPVKGKTSRRNRAWQQSKR